MIRTQIILEETQHEALLQIAREEKRSLSDLVRALLDEQLCIHEQRQLAQAAELLRQDYLTDSELTAFTVLDGEAVHEAG
jgi:predicted DNA-binding ribbon-helix-helix protein